MRSPIPAGAPREPDPSVGSARVTGVPRRSRWREVAIPALVYTVATAWGTWRLPMFAAHAVFDVADVPAVAPVLRADALLTIWILRWDTHALASHPLHLFDANIFHPVRNTLAMAEHLLGDLPLFLPLWLVTANPVLAYNGMVLASFVLSGLFMHLVIRAWTGNGAAAYAAGFAFAFAPWRIPDGLSRPQLLQVQYFPLILAALDRTARTGTIRVALAAALVLAVQSLCSYYLAYQAFLVAGALVLADLVGRGWRGRGRALGLVGFALLGAVIVVVPVTLPYLHAQVHGGLPFQFTEAQRFFALVTTTAVLARHAVGTASCVIGLLALVPLARSWSTERARGIRILALLVITVAGFVLARGPVPLLGGRLQLYDWLGAVVPGFGNLRAPARFAIVASFGTAGLAGFAVAAGLRALAGTRRGPVFAAVIAGIVPLAVLVSLARVPRINGWGVPVGADVPAVYGWLALHGEGRPLLELPVRPAYGRGQDAALAMYFSTYHWLPLVNGYSGYYPPSYEFIERNAARLPNAEALQALVDCTGVGWLLAKASPPLAEPYWSGLRGARFRASFPGTTEWNDALYEVLDAPRARCPVDTGR
jgi:hypothetical protein